MIQIDLRAEKMLDEPMFELFRHEGLLCCVQRIPHFGTVNGYVAVTETHSLFGKDYRHKVHCAEVPQFNGNYIGLLIASANGEHELDVYSLDMAIKVHGGLTYAGDELSGIEQNLFGKLWWFGFDTAHAGDLKPYQTDIDRQFMLDDGTYKDFEYVKAETKSLAEQLSKY